MGPEVNRNWAIDGTMWICDGHRLHRYDPTTLEPITVIELTISCDFVYEGSGLVVVWTYDEDPAESGTSAAVVIDRATWTVSSTIDPQRETGGGGVATDGRSIFVPTHDDQPADVLVIDAETFEVADTIQPLEVNGVLAYDGSLWVAHQRTNVLQRFDLPK